MNKISFTLLITASFMLASTSFAAKHMHGVKTKAINGCDNAQILQRCAKTMTSTFDKKGRLWSAWTIKQSLYVNHSDNQGETFSTPVLVNNTPEKISARNEHRPKIKVSQQGIIYLSWTTKLKKRFTGNIRFSKSTDNGNTFSSPITVNDNHDIISHRFDSLAVNIKGHIYISWLDKRDQAIAEKNKEKYTGAAAYYSVSRDNGNTFSKNKKIADNSCECCRMATDIDTNDLPVIAWRHIYGKNTRDHSIVSFKDTNTISLPRRLSHDQWKVNGCPHHGPSLSINKSNNRYHSVWFNNAEKRHGIFYANSDSSGDTFSTPINIGNYDKQASHADVKSLKNQVYIVWREFETPYSKILVKKSNTNGNSWGKEKVIAKAVDNSDHPFLVEFKDEVFLSWHIQGQKYKLIKLSSTTTNNE